MLIKVTYNKTSGEIAVSSDIRDIAVEVNTSEISDTAQELNFEIAVDTTSYEIAQSSLPFDEIIE